MSRIHSSCALVGPRSAARFGAARNRIVNIMNSRVEGITRTARPHHCFAPVRGAGASVSVMTHLARLMPRCSHGLGPSLVGCVLLGREAPQHRTRTVVYGLQPIE